MSTEEVDQTKAIGAAVRSYRKAKGLTLRELADASGLSAGFLSLAERGRSAFALTSLRAIATAMDLRINDFLAFEADTTGAEETNALPLNHEVHIHHADEPAGLEIIASGHKYQLLSSAWPGRQLEPILVTVPPHLHDEVPAGHEGEEICYVLKGELVFIAGEEEHLLREGDSIHIDSRLPHALRNLSDRQVETLWVVTPPILFQSESVHVSSRKRKRT